MSDLSGPIGRVPVGPDILFNKGALGMQIYDIKVDYTKDTIGIDNRQPFFSWKIKADKSNIFQENYRIEVFDNENLAGDACWDSGTVESGKSFAVRYNGKELLPDSRYCFKITVTVNDEILKSEVCSFATALLSGKMQGKWICINEDTAAAPLVRKKFNALGIKRATLYFFSYGWYELYVNGQKFDSSMFLSNHSGYKKILFYDVFDLTDFIRNGENCVGFIIGDGYNKNASRFMETWKGKKRFIGFISIEKANGEKEYIYSDDSWKYTDESPILFNNIYDGEIYDARRELGDWSSPDYNDSNWKNAASCNEEEKIFKHIPGAKTNISEMLHPVKILKSGDESYIFDFGQNIAGFVKLSLKGEPGKTVTVKYAEELKLNDNAGERPKLDTFTNRYAKSTDKYTFKSYEKESYHPHFTYHGFRYAEISGIEKEPETGSIIACAVHTQFNGEAYFKTDNELINRLYSNALWSVKSNNISYPSDCAARDERTPCSMDILTYQDAAVYFADLHNYFTRWLYCAYNEDETGIKFPSWDGQSIVMTKLLYMHYGDIGIIEAMREHNVSRMDKYMAQWPDAEPKDDEVSFGDWCIPNVPGNYETSAESRKEVEIASLALCADSIAYTERALGNISEATRYYNYYELACKAYNKLFFEKERALYSGGKQTPNILALSEDLVADVYKPHVAENLIKNIGKSSKLDTGIFGTRYFIECLSDSGNIDLAFKCFFNNEFPSFKYQFDKGATTLWEQWYETGNMASHNHAMFAGAVTGLFTRLAGITPLEPGFPKILIKPIFSGMLNRLETAIDTPFGKLEIEWVRENGEISVELKIPPNASAVLILPGEPVNDLSNGKYKFKFKEIKQNGKNNR